MESPDALVKRADDGYQPFPPLEKWLQLTVDNGRWQRLVRAHEELRAKVDSSVVERARVLMQRFAAVETGAIEGLYDLDSGFTITAATNIAAFEAALHEQESRKRSYIESQLKAYDYVLDLATASLPVNEAWLRQLHEVICGPPGTLYTVRTPLGLQERVLPLGQYKKDPNHVQLEDGKLHSYAPVSETAPEMARLIEAINSAQFQEAHPAIQAAYSHYCVVWIHPFADGNGRVARALASVFSYRALSVPILFTADAKQAYLGALREADHANAQSFATYVFNRMLETIRLVDATLKTAQVPAPETALAALRQAYSTRAGLRHLDVDDSSYRLWNAFVAAFTPRLDALVKAGSLGSRYNAAQGNYNAISDSRRSPRSDGGRILELRLTTPAPGDAEYGIFYRLEVPRDAAAEDEIAVVSSDDREVLLVPIDDVIKDRTVVPMLIQMAVERELSIVIGRLHYAATARLRDRGY